MSASYEIDISRRPLPGTSHDYGRTGNGTPLTRSYGRLELGIASADEARYVFADLLARFPDHDLRLSLVDCRSLVIAEQGNPLA